MDENSDREEKKGAEWRGGCGGDGEESVGGPTCWKTKDSEDERTRWRERERMREEHAARLKCLLM